MTETEELACLRAAVMTIHEHLHRGNVELAHQAAHDAIHGDGPRVHQPNLTLGQSNTIALFSRAMMRVAENYQLEAVCWVVAMPSATTPGATSFQIGGNAQLCEFIEARFR